MKLTAFTDEELREKLKNSDSMWGFCKSVGYTNKSSRTYTYVREHLKLRGIDADLLKNRRGAYVKRTDENVFCENSTVDRKDLKNRIIAQNRLEYKCSSCGVTSWQGQPISLQLDHINGTNNDNRIENLRFLCPNCHSQTKTWGNKSPC